MYKPIITCALTGAQQGKETNPNLPEQPEEIIQQGVEAWRAGAAVLHIHARDEEGRATAQVSVFRRIVEGLRDAGCKAVLNLSTGGAVTGLPLEERLNVIPELQPEIASFSVGGGCLLGRYDTEDEKWINDQFVQLISSYQEMEEAAHVFKKHGVRPELEIYHPGMLNNVRKLLKNDLLDEPILVNFVMGIPGECNPPTVRRLVFLVNELPENAHWLVSAIGARNHFRMIGPVAAMGGNIRIGMEDNIYIGRGELARSNGEMVEKAVRLLDELGVEPADHDEARKILNLKKEGR